MKLTEEDVLKTMIDMAHHNICCYSRNHIMTQPKEGFEKQWEEARDVLEVILRIEEKVRKEDCKCNR